MDSDKLLTCFREEWRRELTARDSSVNETQSRQNVSQGDGSCNESGARESDVDGIHSEVEKEAADLFDKGVQLEQNGQLYESIRFYRKAILLVSDIELRVHHRNVKNREEDCVSEREEGATEDPACADLVSRFESVLSLSQPICEPNFLQESAHLSCLPAEMVERILTWVVGSELDVEAMEGVAGVCRGLFLLCRKPEIWRKSCIRVWGVNTGPLGGYESWRAMFVSRPRPRFNGCYVSRTTYFRSGENSFQDLSYQPWHIVCYYRYLRFFPHGDVLMLTSAEEPQTVVSHLKRVDTKYPQVLCGHFRIHGSSLTMLFRKPAPSGTGGTSGGGGCGSSGGKKRMRGRKGDLGTTDIADTTFQMELELKAARGGGPPRQLAWRCYSVVSAHRGGAHSTSVVGVADPCAFPSFFFSRVKSYTAQAEAPLV